MEVCWTGASTDERGTARSRTWAWRSSSSSDCSSISSCGADASSSLPESLTLWSSMRALDCGGVSCGGVDVEVGTGLGLRGGERVDKGTGTGTVIGCVGWEFENP